MKETKQTAKTANYLTKRGHRLPRESSAKSKPKLGQTESTNTQSKEGTDRPFQAKKIRTAVRLFL